MINSVAFVTGTSENSIDNDANSHSRKSLRFFGKFLESEPFYHFPSNWLQIIRIFLQFSPFK